MMILLMTNMCVCNITLNFIFRMGNHLVNQTLNIFKFYDFDHARTIAFAIGRTEHTIRAKVDYLKKKGMFRHYKNLNKHW